MMYCLAFGLLLCALSCESSVLPMSQPMMAVKVEAGDYRVGETLVVVRELAALPIDAPESVVVRGEQVVISDEPCAAYYKGTALRETLGPVDKGTRVPMAIVPDSVRICSCSEPPVCYLRDKDYHLDTTWGGFSRIDGGKIAKGATVCVDSSVHRQRIDAVQVSSNGKASVKKGVPAAVCPEMPSPDAGSVVLAYIHVQFRTTAITADDIYPVPADAVTWQDYIKTSGLANLGRTLALLRSKQPVTIVCWGDSVTAGGSASAPEKRYVDLLRSRLKAAYPGTEITVVNAGIGGSSTESRRAGYDSEVLAHKPDLVTVEYVNDCGLPPEKIAENYAEFTSRAREKLPDVEFIIITPHFMRPDWMRSYDQAVKAMRDAALDNGAALADTSHIWANLRRVGIPYMTLLANEINHPNDLGHEFFAATLMELLRPDCD